jgi:hypothetical protein
MRYVDGRSGRFRPCLSFDTDDTQELFMSPFTKTAAAMAMAGAVLVAAAAPSEARGGRWAAAAGIGLATGALIGAAAAQNYYYGPGYYRYPGYESYGYSGYGYVAPGYGYAHPYAYEPVPVYVEPAPVYYGPLYYNNNRGNGTTWVPGTSSPRVNIQ